MGSEKDISSTVKEFRVWDARGKIMIYPSPHMERDDLLNRSHQTVFFDCGCMFKQDGLDDEPRLIQHCKQENLDHKGGRANRCSSQATHDIKSSTLTPDGNDLAGII